MFSVANHTSYVMNNFVAINHLPNVVILMVPWVKNIIMNIIKYDKDKIIVAQGIPPTIL